MEPLGRIKCQWSQLRGRWEQRGESCGHIHIRGDVWGLDSDQVMPPKRPTPTDPSGGRA